MSSNTTTLKFFLAGEIHRVSIASASPTLTQVLDSITTIFSSFKSADRVRVQYIDEDGDCITVNTQAEWLEALETLKESSVKKIYLTEKEEEVEEAEEAKTTRDNPRSISNARFQAKNCKVPKEDLIARIANGEDFKIPVRLGKQQKLSERLRLASAEKIDSKEYSQALNLLKTTLKMQPNSESDLYNLACIYALMGNQDKASAKLKRAVNCGFKDLAFIEQDKDLDSIRDSAAYKEAVEGLRSGPSTSAFTSYPRRRFNRGPPVGQAKSTLLKSDIKPQEKKKRVYKKPAPAASPEIKTSQPEVKQVKQEQAAETKSAPYAKEKKQLLEMGFANEELLEEMLIEKKGDVEAVSDILLNMKL
eukprot:TRINITY_DN1151_c0_g1_i3.p1 TRINITY_DN1151_c0_g1~~TRINITY_DN1151_c0_g1_i3.p1  ORF type:complete len:380 (+),score=150.65 TRINITY_DN1151_c0_g1_i3:56-1141(+)